MENKHKLFINMVNNHNSYTCKVDTFMLILVCKQKSCIK